MLKLTENQETPFSPALIAQFDAFMNRRYPLGKQKAGLLPLLHIVQAEYGWVSPHAMDQVAAYLDIKPIEVYEVATFYTMFFLKPQAKYVLEVCRTGPCGLVGADKIMKHIENTLGVNEGEITADGLFSWRGVECLAACGTAPVLQIGPAYTYYENLTVDKVDELINELKNSIES